MSDLEFKPITEGLGFHPFADGLPYAPGSKSPTASTPAPTTPKKILESRAAAASTALGTGATAAGIARPVRMPQPAVTLNAPLASPAPFTTAQAAQQKAAQTQAAHELHASVHAYGWGYLLERIAAFTLDSALILAGLAAGTSYYLVNFAVPSGREMNTQDLAYVLLVVMSLHWALLTFQEVAFGTTIGKRIFGLRVPGSASGVFLRAFFFVPSVLVAGLGLMTAAFDSRGRCLHDLITDIQPVRWN